MKTRNTKLQTPKKFQISSSKAMAQQQLLGLGAWDFSGAWRLEFGVSPAGLSDSFVIRHSDFVIPPPVLKSAIGNWKSTIAALFASFAVSAIATDATLGASKNWPQWRGPNAQGVSEAKGLPEKWSPTEHIKWKVDLPGAGDSSPCVWGDRVFITASIPQGDEIKAGNPDHPKPTGPMAEFRFMRYRFQILCFNRLSGERIWAQTVPFENQTKTAILLMGSYANATPATDGEAVCVYFGMRWLLCYDLEGTLKWRHEFPDEDPVSAGSDGDSPIVTGDRVIVVREGSTGAAIVVLNKQSGETLWQVKRDEDQVSYATPVILDVGGKRQIAVNATKRIRSYDYDTGVVIWECDGMTKGVVPTIVFGQGMVFAASSAGAGIIKAIKLGRTGELGATDAVAWSATRGAPHVSTPLLYHNELYAVTDTGIVTCFDAKTGKARFDERLPGIPSILASPVAANGKVYFLGENGKMVILKAGPVFEVLATNEIPEKFHASPALVDGMILLRSEHHLFCISDN